MKKLLNLAASFLFLCPTTYAESFNVNFWPAGSSSPPSPWADPNNLTLLQIAPTEIAGAPGWETAGWQNVGQANGFIENFPATTINGSEGSTVTFEIINQRNAGSYFWASLRDPSSHSNPNASLLDGHSNSTEFDEFSGSGAPFPERTGSIKISNIPFATYDIAIYFGVNEGQAFDRIATVRINEEIPTDPTDKTGGTTFTLPNGEPDGTLDEITADGDTGNYIIYNNLSGTEINIQTWGKQFNHIGIAGIQIRETGGVTAGPVDPNTSTLTASTNSVAANGSASTQITVTLRDANGIPIAGENVTLNQTGGSGSATISPTTASTNAAGQAVFTVTSNTVESQEFSATVISNSLTLTQTTTIDFVAPPATGDLFNVNLWGFFGSNPGGTAEQTIY